MGTQLRILAALCFLALAGAAVAEVYTIPPEKVDEQQIFYGATASFERPGRVQYERVVKATPEYSEIKKKKVESGTAKYWILMSEASNHAVRAIAAVGKESDYDLIAADGYLRTLDPPIQADDVTDLVLKKLEE